MFFVLALATLAVAVHADVPQSSAPFDVVPFRGRIELGTEPAPQTEVKLRFRVYSSDAANAPALYEQDVAVTPSKDGEFVALLGPTGNGGTSLGPILRAPSNLQGNAYVGIAVLDSSSPPQVTAELQGRQRLLAAPFAARVAHISSDDIDDGQVKSSDLADSAVTSTKLAASAVQSAHIANGTIKAEDLSNLGCNVDQMPVYRTNGWACVSPVPSSQEFSLDAAAKGPAIPPAVPMTSTSNSFCFLSYIDVGKIDTEGAICGVSAGTDGNWYLNAVTQGSDSYVHCKARCLSF